MKAMRFVNRRAGRLTVALATVAVVAVASTVTAGARTSAPSAQQGKVKAVAFFGFAASYGPSLLGKKSPAAARC